MLNKYGVQINFLKPKILSDSNTKELSICIELNNDLNYARDILRKNPIISHMKIIFGTDSFYHTLTIKKINFGKVDKEYVKNIAILIEEFKQISKLEIIGKFFNFFDHLFLFFDHIEYLSNIKSIIFLIDFEEPYWKRFYTLLSKLTWVTSLSIYAEITEVPDLVGSEEERISISDYKKEFNEILTRVNTLSNLKSLTITGLALRNECNGFIDCQNLLKENKTLRYINIPMLDPLPKEVSERNCNIVKFNLLLLIYGRENNENSLFYKDYLPLDMFKLILHESDLNKF
jgi:hypothetical protein